MAPPGALPGRTVEPRAARARARAFIGAGVMMWMALLGPLQAGVVRQRGSPRLRGRGALRRRGRWQRPHVVGVRLLPRLRAGRATWDITPLADQGAAGAVMMIERASSRWGSSPGSSSAGRARPRRASACWTSRTKRAASRSTRREPRRAVAAGQGAAPGGTPQSRADRSEQPVSSTCSSSRRASASLGAEIAAARLMAPFFGASTIVWANTIGVVLVALSIGYWLGGRIGDRYPTCAACACWCWAPRCCWRWSRSWPSRSSTSSVDALDEISAGASSARSSASWC